MIEGALRVQDLAEDPLDAAGQFHARVVSTVRARFREFPTSALVIVFAPADHTHRAWRVAAIRELAREAAPGRVNAIAGDDETAIAAATRYLADAPGVTGQYLPLADGR